jgi:hypothetical protein
MKKISLFIVLLAVSTLSFGEVVYDSISSSTTSFTTAFEVGDTVALAGTKRYVTKFTFPMSFGSSKIGKTAKFRLMFYLPSAPGGCPAKQTWQSSEYEVLITDTQQEITLDVPYVRVNDTFIWSLQNSDAGSFRVTTYATTGSTSDYYWVSLKKKTFLNYIAPKVRIEAQDNPNWKLLATNDFSGSGGIGDPNVYLMNFNLRPDEFDWTNSMFFSGVNEYEERMIYFNDLRDDPELVQLLTNGEPDRIGIYASGGGYGDTEDLLFDKEPGVAEDSVDFKNYYIKDIALVTRQIDIDHSTPGWTYYDYNVTWEIWGKRFPGDINKDGIVTMKDFAILSSAWNNYSNNPLADISGPECGSDGIVDYHDLIELCSSWLDNVEDIPIE